MSCMLLRSRRFLKQQESQHTQASYESSPRETDLDDIYSATVELAVYQSITVKVIVDVVDLGQLILSYCLQK